MAIVTLTCTGHGQTAKVAVHKTALFEVSEKMRKAGFTCKLPGFGSYQRRRRRKRR